MSTDRWMRASDQDREDATELLRDGYAVGRLSRAELEQRSAAAYAARTWGELRDLTGDLPAAPTPGLPADIVARRHATRRAFAPIMWVCLVALGAELVARAFPGAVWMIAAACVALLLLFAPRHYGPGRSRRGGSR
jgi:Domain of unknown function (DUF1707)